MTTETKLLTADEFMDLPDSPEGGKMELVYGEVVTMSPVGGEHGEVATEIGTRLHQFARGNHLGRVGVEIGYRLKTNPDLVRAPDVSFRIARRLTGGRFPRSYVDGPPTLAVEVVSPGDRDVEVATKVEEYLEAGTDRVWVVRPELQTIMVYRPGGKAHVFHSGDRLTSDDAGFGVEGFELPVDEVFA